MIVYFRCGKIHHHFVHGRNVPGQSSELMTATSAIGLFGNPLSKPSRGAREREKVLGPPAASHGELLDKIRGATSALG